MSGLRVAVAGGGLGGLCLAQGLLKAGVDVTVYERDAQLAGRRQGYRLHVDARAGLALEQCLPPGSLALFQATCSEASTRLTVVSERLRVLNEQRRTGSADPYAPATLSTSVNRQTLREVLAAGLDGRLVFGCELTGYELTGGQDGLADHGDGRDGVRLHFADGRQAEADLLVGADGVGSAVRRQYLPAAAPADTGTRCVYGTIPLGPAEADRLPSALRDGFTAVIGGQVGMATGVVRFRQRPEQAAPWLSPAGDYLMWAVAGDGKRFGVPDERLTAMSAGRVARADREADQELAPGPARAARASRRGRDVPGQDPHLTAGAAVAAQPGDRARRRHPRDEPGARFGGQYGAAGRGAALPHADRNRGKRGPNGPGREPQPSGPGAERPGTAAT